MVLSKLFRRSRRRATNDPQPPVIITVKKRTTNTRGQGASSYKESVLSNSGVFPNDDHHVAAHHHERPAPPPINTQNLTNNLQQQHLQSPTNVTVKARVIMKEDRICNTVEHSGDKVSHAVELVAFGIVALVVVNATVTLAAIWSVLVLVGLHYHFEWPTFVVFITCLSMIIVGMGVLLWNLGQRQWIQYRKEYLGTAAASLRHNSTEASTVSELGGG